MVTQAELEAKLWGAADILRGAIDSSDYKNYIFGFLFLKRLSDVFEEEAEKKTGFRKYDSQKKEKPAYLKYMTGEQVIWKFV